MLKELYIENLAVIEKTVINFVHGFNVFSGETGAGKSILIGGINAVLGGRVSKTAVRSGADKAVVTALFTNIPEKVRVRLNEYGYGDNNGDSELLLNREISNSGNSFARINGKTATAAVLNEIAADLIDVHGQHQTRLIVSRDTQLELIDSYAQSEQGFDGLMNEYREAFRAFAAVNKRIKDVERDVKLKDEKIELLTGKVEDLRPYKLQKGEEETVESELNRLRNIKTLTDTLNSAYYALNGDNAAVDLLNLCKTNLEQASRFLPECAPLTERVTALAIEIDDVKSEILPLISDNTNTEKLPFYEERMSDFLRLKRKYTTVATIDELVDQLEAWENELALLQDGDNVLKKLYDEKKSIGIKVKQLGEKLTEKRKAVAETLAKMICAELEYLDMPGTTLSFEVTQGQVTLNGMDSIEMLISVNKGEQPKPLNKIASGGELSRVMLAIKSVFAKNDDIGSMVFDEIDTGISGRAAHKVGLKMSALSSERQVLCVTHLAQIAAMADNHLLIEKSVSSDGRTYTNVKSVTGEERKRELARIISGDDDELSLANAERLIQNSKKPVWH